MNLPFKSLIKEAVLPTQATAGSCGYDLTATSIKYHHMYIEYGTGLATAIPEGYVGLLAARSSISNMNLILANSLGILDSDYRGEIKLRFRIWDPKNVNPEMIYKIGDRIGQLVISQVWNGTPTFVDDLDWTVRGVGGFGSSDR